MSVNIRSIRLTELSFLDEMLYEAIFQEPGADPLPKEIIQNPDLAKYINDFGKDKFDVCYVAEVKDELIGACWGRVFSIENPGYGFFNQKTPELSIAISPEYRNQGIGSRLIKALIAYYQKLKIQQISLSVDKSNPAYGLYQRLGFESIETTEKSALMVFEV
jgi:ribosomal protein S18 acetylase RimI-like enzyme